MIDLVNTILTSPFGSFAFVASIMLVLFYVMHKTGQWREKINNTDNSIKEIKEDIRDINTTISEIKGDMQYVRSNINHINDRLTVLENKYVETKSPISLTEEGKELANKLNIYNLIDNYWYKVEDYFKNNNITNMSSHYDIQEACLKFINNDFYKMISKEDLNRIKDFAYNNGNNINDYNIILGIIIRDKFLNKVENKQ